MELINAVRTAAEANGITGVMALTERCGLSYERTRRIWSGDTSAKVADVQTVMESLGYSITYGKMKSSAYGKVK